MNTLEVLNAMTLAVALAGRLLEVAEKLRSQFAQTPEVTPQQMDEALKALDAEIARAKKLQSP